MIVPYQFRLTQENRMIRRLWLIGLLVGLFFSLGAAQDDKSYSADRFDVAVTVEEGGSLLVQETVTFRFVGGPFTFVFRELPTDHTDGITDIVATVDGRTLPAGTNSGQVEINGRDPIRVTWHFEPTLDTVHTFSLTYRVLGVVQQSQAADLLKWQALPDEYEYSIGRSQVTFNWPAAVEPSAAPAVLAGDGSLEHGPGSLVWTAQNLEPGDPLVIQVPFAAGSLITAPPAWQARQLQHSRYAWVWAVAAGGVLLAGVVALVIAFRPYQSSTAKDAGPSYQPPSNLSPVIAGILHQHSNSPNWQNALGTVFDLAGRGVLAIEETPKANWFSSPDFVIQQISYPPDLASHEKRLLQLLFRGQSGQSNEVKLSKLSQIETTSHWREYAKSFQAELEEAGYLSAERLIARRRWQITAGVLLFLALALFLMALLLLSVFGGWPLLVAGSFLLLSIIWFIAASALSVLSKAGEQVAAEWQAFYLYLQEVSRGKAAISRPDMFEQYLPYAAAFGLLATWSKQFKKSGWTQVPHYFHPLSRAGSDGMAAFAVMTTTSASTGGASGGAGAAGAGAAGGGASGAG